MRNLCLIFSFFLQFKIVREKREREREREKEKCAMVVTTPKGFKKSHRKQYLFIFFVFACGLSMYLFILSIATRDARDVGPGDELPGDFLSRETFEQGTALGHRNTNGWHRDDTGNLDAYHRELENERLRKREKEKEELERLREKVEKEKVLREEAERKLAAERQKKEHAMEEKTVENSRSRSTHEHEKETFGDGFYEKPGLNVEQWRRARDAETKERYDECHMIKNSEYWGPTPVPGDLSADNGARNRKETWQECCDSCKEHSEECNTWRYDPRNKNCWLAKNKNVWQPPTYGKGDAIPYTSGMLHPEPVKYDPKDEGGSPPTCITTMITSNGGAYMNWQTRLVYASWKNVAMKHDKAGIMARFIRILHRTKDDELVGIIPTWRADPWHPECDNSCSYSVKDRARAIYEWSLTEDAKKCSHVLMAEADYIFIKAPPPSVLLQPGHSYGFLFGYIIPTHADAMPASKVFHEGYEDKVPYAEVAQTGNAPQIMYANDLARVAKRWKDLMVVSEESAVIQKVFGWVRDMYAFSFAAAQIEPPIQFRLPPVPFADTMVQIPADVQLGKAIAMHYTWGPEIKIGPKPSHDVVWAFDKRKWSGAGGVGRKFQKIPMTPEWDKSKDYRLNADEVLQETQLEVLKVFAEYFNDAVDMANQEKDIVNSS